MGKYSLVITEKPDAAKRIAESLDFDGKPRKMVEDKVPYYLAKRNKNLVVVPALGHLYTVTSERKERGIYPVFKFKWARRNLVERRARQIGYWVDVISKLAKNADVFIDACDYDIEGSIIGYCIMKYACGGKEKIAKRMKFSTLTKDELEKAYFAVRPHLDFGLIEAGLTRHEVDWLYGVNLTRALTMAAKNWSGKYKTLSTGRVQGPTLGFLAIREKSIKCFVPKPYWSIKAKIVINKVVLEAEYEKDKIENKKEAEAIVDNCIGKKNQIERTEIRRFKQNPPVPFDLGSLQREAYSLFRYAPINTLRIVQQLYLDALISYPRTSSQRLPATIDYRKILEKISKVPGYNKPATQLLAKTILRPTEGEKDDPAHPAIYPTGKSPNKTHRGPAEKIWGLITRRFMAVFGAPALKQNTKAFFQINDNLFILKTRQTLNEGWLKFYGPYTQSEEPVSPLLKKGQRLTIQKVILEDRFTRPPTRYNPSSLLKRMEDEKIGTKSTRASITQTLCNRKYIRAEKIVVTDLGFEVFEILQKYCPKVVSPELTRDLEEKMNRVRLKTEKREEVIADTVKVLKLATKQIKANERKIGEKLSQAIEQMRLKQKTIGT